ncbi:MAG: hypothetical protein PsegKO_29100 [Pseudohongiellaceae bacterium]
MRYIAIFLVLANLALLGWNLWRGQTAVSGSQPAQSDTRPLLNTGLTLLSEYQDATAEQQRRDAEANRRCSLVTGFDTVDDAYSFIAEAEQQGLLARLGLTGEALPSQYRVYLSPASSRSIATITLDGLGERLAESGLSVESYLITRGVLENAIALGVYEEQAAAEEVIAAVAALGYDPQLQDIPRSTGDVQVLLDPGERPQVRDTEWLDLTAERPGLSRSENVCETLVQAPQFQ